MTTDSYSTGPASPSLIRVQGLGMDATWPELLTRVKGKNRRDCTADLVKTQYVCVGAVSAFTSEYNYTAQNELFLQQIS